MQLLLVKPEDLPEAVTRSLADAPWNVTTATTYKAAISAARSTPCDAVLLAEPHGPNRDADRDVFTSLLRLLDAEHMAAIVVGDADGGLTPRADSLIDVVAPDITWPELTGRLATIARYHSMLTHLQGELVQMEQLGKRLNDHFAEVDQEMKLAARLQRDFLPNVDEPFDGIRFSTIFRPASWVSGDIYDVFRADEQHLGFYVADAVGHGMAAGLLTMFIKRSIVSKRIKRTQYALLEPSETISLLNDALADQALPNCQFVTACYCLLNTKTLTLKYARGGHPYPLLIHENGDVSELKTNGGLLGLFKADEFPTLTTQLKPGDKLILYTDGVEMAYGTDGAMDAQEFIGAIRAVAHRPIDEITEAIAKRLDEEAGSLSPKDDLTVVGVEIPRD